MNETYQYDLVQKLSFVRYGGTAEEKKAAEILMEEIKAAGGEGHYEEFTIPAFELGKCSLKVTAPFEMEIETIPYGLSGSLPEGGMDLKFMYENAAQPMIFTASKICPTQLL